MRYLLAGVQGCLCRNFTLGRAFFACRLFLAGFFAVMMEFPWQFRAFSTAVCWGRSQQPSGQFRPPWIAHLAHLVSATTPPRPCFSFRGGRIGRHLRQLLGAANLWGSREEV